MGSHNNSSQKSGTTVSKTLDEEELDKLLQGLDQLTETLPDLSSPSRHQPIAQQQPKMETLNSHTSLYSTASTNGMKSSNGTSNQPYHTRVDSKPFSYFRTSNNLPTGSNSRASNNGSQ